MVGLGDGACSRGSAFLDPKFLLPDVGSLESSESEEDGSKVARVWMVGLGDGACSRGSAFLDPKFLPPDVGSLESSELEEDSSKAACGWVVGLGDGASWIPGWSSSESGDEGSSRWTWVTEDAEARSKRTCGEARRDSKQWVMLSMVCEVPPPSSGTVSTAGGSHRVLLTAGWEIGLPLRVFLGERMDCNLLSSFFLLHPGSILLLISDCCVCFGLPPCEVQASPTYKKIPVLVGSMR